MSKVTRATSANLVVHIATTFRASHEAEDLVLLLSSLSIKIGCNDLAMKMKRSCAVSIY